MEEQKQPRHPAEDPSDESPEFTQDEIASSSPEEDDDDYSLPLSARREREPFRFAPPAPEPEPEASQEPLFLPQEEYRDIPKDKGFTLRALTESAMMIAISLTLALVGYYVPVISVIGILLYPLPMVVLVLRRGVKVGIASSLALAALSVIFFGVAQALLMLVEYGLLGLFLGWCFRSGRGALFSLSGATIIAAVGTALSLLLSLYISGIPIGSLLSGMEDSFRESMEYMISQGSALFVLPEGMEMEAYLENMLDLMIRLLPAVLILTAMLLTLVFYLICTKVLRRMRYSISQLPRFTAWRMDWRFSWGVILGLFCLLLGNNVQLQWLSDLGMNLLYVFAPVLFLCGLAFFIWFVKFEKYGPMATTFFAVILVVFFNVSMWMFMLLAIFDPLLDLRGRLIRRRTEDKQ